MIPPIERGYMNKKVNKLIKILKKIRGILCKMIYFCKKTDHGRITFQCIKGIIRQGAG